MANTASFSHSDPAANHRSAVGPDMRTSLKVLLSLQRKPIETLQSLTHQYGGIVRLQPGPSQLWVISDPQHLQHPLYEHTENYARSGLFRSLKPALGDGLMVTANNDRAGLHELLRSAFQPKRMRQLSKVIQRCVEQRAEQWSERKNSEHELAEEMQQLSLEVLCRMLFGREGDSVSRKIQPLLRNAHRWMDSRSENIFNVPGWMPSARNRQLKAAMAELDRILTQQLQHARPRMRDADTLVDLLVGLDSTSGEPLSPEVLVIELRGLLMLAQRNLASSLFWSTWLLSRNEESRSHVEIEARTLADRVEEESITAKAAYSRMVVEESLRLYPPTWTFSRQLLNDDEIGGHHLSAGSLLLIPNILIHRNSSIWPDAEQFQPERFSAVNRVNRQRGAWLPFGAGPMQCVGEQLSIAVLQLTILHISGIGHWQPETNEEPGLAANLVLEPSNKVVAKFVRNGH